MGKSPEATRLHQEYLMSSRRQQTMGQRKLLIGVSIALIVAIGLSILSSFLFATTETQRGQLDRAYQTAVALADEADTLLQSVITNPPSILLVYDANSYVIVNRYPDTRLNVDEMAFSDGRNLVQIDDSTRLDFGECVQFVTSNQPDDSALERVCRTRNAWYSVANAFWLGSGQFQVGTASGFRLGVCDQHSGGGRSFCFIEVSVSGDDD
jgi:hypothetical protein